VDNSKHNPGNAILRNGVLYTADQGSGALVDANTENAVPIWHSRGYLPHFESPEATQHVTFHLADSLPKTVLLALEAELKTLPDEKRGAERRKRIDAWIDAGHGSCILRNPAIAKMVQGSLLSFDAQRYRLLAWVVMPNHVHALFHPMNGWTVAKTVASWKRFTACKICDHHRLTGEGPSPPIWHREY
jgi:Transposase IS200 like